MTTRVAVSGCFIRPGRVGGAEQALVTLAGALDEAVREDEEWRILTREDVPALAGLPHLRQEVQRQRRPANRVAYELTVLPRRRDVDAWLLPNYLTAPGLAGRVTTVVHDALYAHLPETFSRKKRAWLRVAHTSTLRLADEVVAISRFVADDLVRLYGTKHAAKIHVIPHPVLPPTAKTERAVPGVPDGEAIVLCVSAQWPHKNLATLVRGFAHVVNRRRDAHLVLVGQRPANLIGTRAVGDVEAEVRRLGLEQRVTVTGYIDADQVATLYQRCAVVVVPSLFEGFGLPVVEGLLSGRPVVSTTCGSLPEVGLGLTVPVQDPLDASEFAARLNDVLAEPARYAPSAADVAAAAAHYDPRRIAGMYRDVVLAH